MKSGRVLLLLSVGFAPLVCAQDNPLGGAAARADFFLQNAPRLMASETLYQRSFGIPPHPHLAIGAAALPQSARYLSHEIVSEYSIGRLKGGTELLEFRQLVSMDGHPIQTPAVARRALEKEVQSGDDRIRKQILGEFTKLGLVDVATDYGTILLAFTTKALPELVLTPVGECFIGTEPAVRTDWVQRTGGAIEFRGRKVARRPLAGSIWVRQSDGMPLRISASFEHEEPEHVLRDEASVDYTVSAVGIPVPATVVHRHYVDGKPLTENLYTYSPFRLFTTDTHIRYSDNPVEK